MEFHFEHIVPLPIELLFRFHEDPAHLVLLHEQQQGFQLLHHDGTVFPGSTTWIELMVGRCIPVILGFRHATYEPPRCFSEELIHGPFCRFSHCHQFQQVEKGTLLVDTLNVSLPWYFGGELSLRLLVAPAMRRVFASRSLALDRLVASGFLMQLGASGKPKGGV
jgi:ligand-binding SRPBCC domain-containing protein